MFRSDTRIIKLFWPGRCSKLYGLELFKQKNPWHRHKFGRQGFFTIFRRFKRCSKGLRVSGCIFDYASKGFDFSALSHLNRNTFDIGRDDLLQLRWRYFRGDHNARFAAGGDANSDRDHTFDTEPAAFVHTLDLSNFLKWIIHCFKADWFAAP